MNIFLARSAFFVISLVLIALIGFVSANTVEIIGSYQIISSAEVHQQPTANSPVIARIDPPIVVHVGDIRGNWLKIFSRLGNPPGFIRKEAVLTTDIGLPVTTARNVFVYSNPDENSLPIAEIKVGTTVFVVGAIPEWLEIRSRQDRPPGFIKKVSVDMEQLEVASPDFGKYETSNPVPSSGTQLSDADKASLPEPQPHFDSLSGTRFSLFRVDLRNNTAMRDENACALPSITNGFQMSNYVLGEIPATTNLWDDGVAKSLLEKAKEFVLARCPRKESYIQVYLYQVPFDRENWRNDWAVFGNFPLVFKFSLAEYANRAAEKKLKEERLRAELMRQKEAENVAQMAR